MRRPNGARMRSTSPPASVGPRTNWKRRKPMSSSVTTATIALAPKIAMRYTRLAGSAASSAGTDRGGFHAIHHTGRPTASALSPPRRSVRGSVSTSGDTIEARRALTTTPRPLSAPTSATAEMRRRPDRRTESGRADRMRLCAVHTIPPTSAEATAVSSGRRTTATASVPKTSWSTTKSSVPTAKSVSAAAAPTVRMRRTDAKPPRPSRPRSLVQCHHHTAAPITAQVSACPTSSSHGRVDTKTGRKISRPAETMARSAPIEPTVATISPYTVPIAGVTSTSRVGAAHPTVPDPHSAPHQRDARRRCVPPPVEPFRDGRCGADRRRHERHEAHRHEVQRPHERAPLRGVAQTSVLPPPQHAGERTGDEGEGQRPREARVVGHERAARIEDAGEQTAQSDGGHRDEGEQEDEDDDPAHRALRPSRAGSRRLRGSRDGRLPRRAHQRPPPAQIVNSQGAVSTSHSPPSRTSVNDPSLSYSSAPNGPEPVTVVMTTSTRALSPVSFVATRATRLSPCTGSMRSHVSAVSVARYRRAVVRSPSVTACA